MVGQDRLGWGGRESFVDELLRDDLEFPKGPFTNELIKNLGFFTPPPPLISLKWVKFLTNNIEKYRDVIISN